MYSESHESWQEHAQVLFHHLIKENENSSYVLLKKIKPFFYILTLFMTCEHVYYD